jgi:hypothetical protein
MFIEYDASKGLHNQAITPEQIVLDFNPAQVKKYKELTTTVLAHFATMQGSEQVKQFVQLCAIKVKFLYCCTMSWEGSDQSVSASPSPALEASAGTMPPLGRAGAISDGENNEGGAGEDKDEGEDEDEGEDDDEVYGEDDDRGGDRAVHFTKRFDPENALDVDRSDVKYPVAKHFLTRFREPHAIAAIARIWPPSIRFSTARSTPGGWHITSAPFTSTRFCNHQPPVN